MSVACCPSHVVRRMLSVACCPSHVVRRMSSVACRLLSVSCCLGLIGAAPPLALHGLLRLVGPLGLLQPARHRGTLPATSFRCHSVGQIGVLARRAAERAGSCRCARALYAAVCAAWAIYSCCRHRIRGAHCVPAADLLDFLSLQRHELSLPMQPSLLFYHPLPKAYALAAKPEPHRASDHFKRHRRLIPQCRRTFVTTVIKRSLAVPSNVKLWLCFFNAFFTLASFANSSQAIPCSAACVSGYGAMAGG